MTLWQIIQAAIPPPAILTEPRPSVDGQKAWASFQRQAEEAKQAARKAHGRVKAIEQAQTEIVHSALRRAVERVAS